MINSQLFKLALTLPYRLANLLRSCNISIVVLVHFYCGLSIVLYCCPFGGHVCLIYVWAIGVAYRWLGFSALGALMVLPVVYGRRATRQRGSDAAAMSTSPCPGRTWAIQRKTLSDSGITTGSWRSQGSNGRICKPDPTGHTRRAHIVRPDMPDRPASGRPSATSAWRDRELNEQSFSTSVA